MSLRWGALAAALLAIAASGCGSGDGALLATPPELELPDAAPAHGAARAERFCPGGVCPPHCAEGLLACDETCVDPSSDSAHCGSCDEACTGEQTCARGVCVPLCGPGQTACGAACADTKTDAANCGRCDQACAARQVCRDGACRER